MMGRAFTGCVYSLGAFFLFSVGDLALKILGGHYNPFVSALYTDILIIVLFLGMAMSAGGVRKHLTARNKLLHLARGLSLTALFILFIYGVQHMPLADAYALIFATPFFTALLGRIFLGEKITRLEAFCILTGFAGVLIILRPGMIPVSGPALAVLGGAFCMGIANVLIKPMDKTETWMSYQFYASLCTIPAALPYLWATGSFQLPAFEHWPLFIAAALGMGIGGVFIVRAFALAPSATAASFHYTQILYGTAFGVLFFGDWPDSWTLLGAAVVIASGLVMLFGVHKNRELVEPDPNGPAKEER